MIGIVILIFILIGVIFKAIFLPIRLLFVVIVPIRFVYGLCVGVYILGWMNAFKWDSVQSSDGIIWMIPCISITILMGLAMDYEIFLFSRVFEYRYKGYNDRASIILVVANTGPIITSAGELRIKYAVIIAHHQSKCTSYAYPETSGNILV